MKLDLGLTWDFGFKFVDLDSQTPEKKELSTWTQREMTTKRHDRVTTQWRQKGDKMTTSKAFK